MSLPIPDKALDRAVDRAEQAFWQSVAESFPTREGELAPEEALMLEQTMREAIRQWLASKITPREEAVSDSRAVARLT